MARERQNISTSTGIFLITDPQQILSYSKIVGKVQELYGIDPVSRWGLDYRLLQSRPETALQDKAPPSLQHVLQLAHMRASLFVAIGQPKIAPEAIASSVKSEPEYDIFVAKVPLAQKYAYEAILTTKMALLWAPKLNLNVVNGVSFQLDDCSIWLGEVKTGPSHVRALVMAIEIISVSAADGTVGADEKDRVQWEIGKIRDDIAFKFSKEEWGYGSEDNIIKAWCEILRIK